MIAKERLLAFLKTQIKGQCKILSQGDACECILCDFDRITYRMEKLEAFWEYSREIDKANWEQYEWGECVVNHFLSRVCERGTKCCGVHHGGRAK
jgi:hypothetical protein